MRKLATALLVAIIALSAASPVLAHGEGKKDKNEAFKLSKKFFKMEERFEREFSDHFVAQGTLSAISGSNLTLTLKHQINLPNVTNNQATIATNTDTKYSRDKKETISLADLRIGNQLIIAGTVSNNLATAKQVHVIMVSGKAYGEVTAKTASSITIKNNVTGVVQTFTTDADTGIAINGDSKTLADVNVGDRGFVKFKTQVSGLVAKFINLFR